MPTSMHYSFVPTQDHPDGGRVLLRDGSAAEIRPARPEDLPLLRQFFSELSSESRHRRFFSASLPSDKTLAEICDNLHPDQQQTLLVLRLRNGSPVIVAPDPGSRRTMTPPRSRSRSMIAFRGRAWERCSWNGWLSWLSDRVTPSFGR